MNCQSFQEQYQADPRGLRAGSQLAEIRAHAEECYDCRMWMLGEEQVNLMVYLQAETAEQVLARMTAEQTEQLGEILRLVNQWKTEFPGWTLEQLADGLFIAIDRWHQPERRPSNYYRFEARIPVLAKIMLELYDELVSVGFHTLPPSDQARLLRTKEFGGTE